MNKANSIKLMLVGCVTVVAGVAMYYLEFVGAMGMIGFGLAIELGGIIFYLKNRFNN